MKLLETLCSIHAPSGEEFRLKNFIISEIEKSKNEFLGSPVIISENIKDNIIVVVGNPQVAVFAHMDSVGFTVRYNNELLPIGSPYPSNNIPLVGFENENPVSGTFISTGDDESQSEKWEIQSETILEPGTTLTYKPNFSIKDNEIESPFLDNRSGVWAALQVMKSVKNGLFVFTTYEETYGGSVEFLAPKIFHEYGISKALVLDATWTSTHVSMGKGTVLSLRDKFIPRFSFIKSIKAAMQKSGIDFQLEVEGSGSSDGGYLQRVSVPIDWCFIGPPQLNSHSPLEKMNVNDLHTTVLIYQYLLDFLHENE